MLKFSRKVCLVVAGASLGLAWVAPASAALPMAEKADVIFADGDDLSLELVDYQKRCQRAQERACKQAERDREKCLKEQERAAKKACKERDKVCREKPCRDRDFGGVYERGCNLFSDGCGHFTDELGDPWTLSGSIAEAMCLDEPCINVGGWMQLGYVNESDGVFNTDPNQVNLQQSWLYAEKVADGSEGLGIGGRVDVVYGTDGANTQAFGNTPGEWDFQNGFDHGIYAWAIPQAYVQIATGDLSVKVGHFFTLQGYEVVAATGNFFYSHALSMNFMEPFTHTGAVATYVVEEGTEIYAGYVYGWDTGYDQFNGSSAWHGGLKVSPMENMSIIYTSTAGNLGWIGDGYSQSLIATTNLSDDLTSVIGGDLVHSNNNVLPGSTGNTFNGISVYNYLIYAISDRVGVGMRNEWDKFDGVSYQTFTVGLNYRPMANVVIRPEYRYQWCPAAEGATPKNPLGIPVDESIFGVDAIFTF